MGLPGEAVDGSHVVNQITDDVWAFLAEERPAAVSLLEQVRDGVALYMVIPLILVIVLAVLGLNTFICIGSGIVSSYVHGIFAERLVLSRISSTKLWQVSRMQVLG